MDAARRAGNAEAIRQLQSIAPYAAPGKPVALPDLFVQRKWLELYGGAMAYRTSPKAETDSAKLSPDYSDEELDRFWGGNKLSEEALLEFVLGIDLSRVSTLRCPLILFEGRHDYNVNAAVAADWFSQVRAPSKRLVWFENSAHELMTEEPGKTLISLVTYALPIAGKTADGSEQRDR
jgi:alpha-beta hydrolase superfamily lysophospholipase